MAVAKFDSLWTLMSKYTFETDSDSRDDFTCVICKKIMVDCYQSPCGCQYCHKCIQGYLGGESKYCPGDKEECKEEHLSIDENVFRRAVLNKKISKLRAYCPNEYCPFMEELTKMEDHILHCTKQALECPYGVLGCDNKGVPKDQISTHLYEDSFKHNNLLIEYIQNMRNELSNNMNQEIGRLKEDLEVTKSEMYSLKEESVIKSNEIEELKTVISELRNDRQDLKLELRIEKEKSIFLNTEIKELHTEISSLKKDLEKYKSEKCSLKEGSIIKENKAEEFEKMKVEVKFEKDGSIVNEREKERRNAEVNLLNKEHKREIKRNEERWRKYIFLNESSSIMNPNILSRSINVDFVWKVEAVSKKRGQNIFSDSFVSDNYRLCLYLWVPINPGKIYLGCAIMKGEKDDDVQWPLRRVVRVSLLDQDSLTSVETVTISYDTYLGDKERLGRPENESNAYISYPTSISFPYLKDRRSVLVHDTLLISVVLSDL